jgi:predicted ATPase
VDFNSFEIIKLESYEALSITSKFPLRLHRPAMSKLDYISIHGFKSIQAIEKLPLGPINVVIGANGSGKSNFVGAFSFLHALREGNLASYVGKASGADNILYFGLKVTPKLKLRISFDDEVNQYEISLSPTNDNKFFIEEEWAYFWGDKKRYKSPFGTGFPSRPDGEAGISNQNLTGTAAYVRGKLASWRIYHFHDTSSGSPLKATAKLNDNRVFRANGENLPAFLYLLKKNYHDSYRMIVKAVAKIAPFFSDFILEPSQLDPTSIRLEWKHVGTDRYFDVSALSDGTLRFIALATLFLQHKDFRPSVILVDEPELGLHPKAITLLASMVEAASAHTQVIITTQSPLLLDHFTPESVLVADRVNEATTFTRLKTEGLERWLKNYSLGQLWEKNELGGRPGSSPTNAQPSGANQYPAVFPDDV